MKIGLIQTYLHWQNLEENLHHFASKIDEVPKVVDLVVLPEMFTSGFTMQPQKSEENIGQQTLNWMVEKAQKKGMAITGSTIYKEGNVFYNRLFFVWPDGTYKYYNKRHLFTLAGEHKAYKRGEEKLLVDYKGIRFCPMICYDLRFPVWARNVEDYDVLLYVANWPAPRIAAWDALLKARAIENMCYAIGVNRIGTDALGHEYPGHTSAYDVLGNQIVFSDQENTLIFSVDFDHIKTQRDKLRFLEDRDAFSW